MELYDEFISQCYKKGITTDAQKAALICDLMRKDERVRKYNKILPGGIQYRLYAKNISATVLLQATKKSGGSVDLSMQGLRNVLVGTPNFLDFYDEDVRETFMQYLTWF